MLSTAEGTRKDSTECAPNNGYYFLPLYDTVRDQFITNDPALCISLSLTAAQGKFVIEVQPPTGWLFNPSKVEVTVDGEFAVHLCDSNCLHCLPRDSQIATTTWHADLCRQVHRTCVAPKRPLIFSLLASQSLGKL